MISGILTLARDHHFKGYLAHQSCVGLLQVRGVVRPGGGAGQNRWHCA